MTNVTVGVFGATGLTGRRVVSNALEHGHTVRTMARNPSKLEIEHPDLSVIEGDFENIAAGDQSTSRELTISVISAMKASRCSAAPACSGGTSTVVLATPQITRSTRTGINSIAGCRGT